MSVLETHMTDAELKAQRKLKTDSECGPQLAKLKKYVEDTFPNAYVECTPGEILNQNANFQIMIIKRGLRTAPGGPNSFTVSTNDVSTIEEGSKKVLEYLKKEESTGLEKLNAYIAENFEKQGFKVYIDEDKTKEQSDKPKVKLEKYKVSVKLSSKVAKKYGDFLLAAEYGPSDGIAARNVLDLLKFKEKKGFLWVNEILVNFAKKRALYEAELNRLKKLKKKAKLSSDEVNIKNHIEIHKERMRKELEMKMWWLYEEFTGEPDFFEGELPKLSKKLHKTLRKASMNKDGAEYEFSTYGAVNAYEEIVIKEYEDKEEQKRQETKANSITKKIRSTLNERTKSFTKSITGASKITEVEPKVRVKEIKKEAKGKK